MTVMLTEGDDWQCKGIRLLGEMLEVKRNLHWEKHWNHPFSPKELQNINIIFWNGQSSMN